MSKVSDIIVERILNNAKEEGIMPWQRTYRVIPAYNGESGKKYKGINRFMLPEGEYLTANQLNSYNKSHKTDYKFQKGIFWFPVVFYKVNKKELSSAEVKKLSESIDIGDLSKDHFIGYKDGYYYEVVNGVVSQNKNVLRYYNVADVQYFKDSDGNPYPSLYSDDIVKIESEEPLKIIEDYVKRENISTKTYTGVPCYIEDDDLVMFNLLESSSNSYLISAFHELVYSTKHKSRLNRKDLSKGEEEIVAEMASWMLCSELGCIDDIMLENSLSYVNYWSKTVNDLKNNFIWLVSLAESAVNYILNRKED